MGTSCFSESISLPVCQSAARARVEVRRSAGRSAEGMRLMDFPLWCKDFCCGPCAVEGGAGNILTESGKPRDVHQVYFRSARIQIRVGSNLTESVFGPLLHLNRLSRGPDCSRALIRETW